MKNIHFFLTVRYGTRLLLQGSRNTRPWKERIMFITNRPALSAEEKELTLHSDGLIDPKLVIDALDFLDLLHLSNSHPTATGLLSHPLRYTNNLTGIKQRTGQHAFGRRGAAAL
jgi:hypothetical protein